MVSWPGRFDANLGVSEEIILEGGGIGTVCGDIDGRSCLLWLSITTTVCGRWCGVHAVVLSVLRSDFFGGC